jgi:hypothetical protein
VVRPGAELPESSASSRSGWQCGVCAARESDLLECVVAAPECLLFVCDVSVILCSVSGCGVFS